MQCPDGTTRTLSVPDQAQNSITASPSPITGAGPPPHVNNGPESTAYPGTGNRRASLARFGTISRSPSMPSLCEERIENYNTQTLPRNNRFRQQALVAGRRASYLDGSSLKNQAGGVNINGRRVTYTASSADLGATEGGAAVSVNEAAKKAAEAEAPASAENENGFLEPF